MGIDRGMVVDPNEPPIVPTDKAPTEIPQPPSRPRPLGEHRTVRVWTPAWYERPDDDPLIECGRLKHHADVWFRGCEHEPKAWEYVESARDLCDELGADQGVLEAIAKVYVTAWELHDTRHVESWPLSLVVLAGLREAGFDVVRRTTCADCERCRWQPDVDCGIIEHEHCETCGHCMGRHGPEIA